MYREEKRDNVQGIDQLGFGFQQQGELALKQCLQNNVQHKFHSQTDKIKYDGRTEIFSHIRGL